MERTIFAVITIIFSLLSNAVFAEGGQLFNVVSNGNSIIITTNVPKHTYPNAGIKIKTPGYTLNGSECKPYANGYCLFSVSDKSAKTISIGGRAGTPTVSLCLDGKGPMSCQNVAVTIAYGYVTNTGNETVAICGITPSGLLTNCKNAAPSSTFNGPTAIAINPAGTYAYVVNTTGDSTSICPVNNDGTFGTCSISNDPAFTGNNGGIWISRDGSYVFTTNVVQNRVYKCPVNAGGSLGTCVDSGAGDVFNHPVGITSDPSGYLYAYIVNNGGNTVTQCAISLDGNTLGPCNDSGVGAVFSNPIGISYGDGGMYITDNSPSNVTFCQLALFTGQFTSCCSNTGANVSGPYGISVNSKGNIAYIANNTSSNISVCTIDLFDGSFSSCALSSSIIFSSPTGILVA